MRVDVLIVGSGLTGATIARLMADAGRDVLVIERRDEIGGNVRDYTHKSGIRMGAHGPHYFRTNSDRIWDFVSRFAEFHPFAAEVMTSAGGDLHHWPIHRATIRELAGDALPGFIGEPSNFEEAALSKMPRVIYELFVRDYTAKQWGCDPRSLDADLCKRFEVRDTADRRLMLHRYQGVPRHGYTAMVRNMLDGIPVVVGFDYLKHRDRFDAQTVIYTGAIDAYFEFKLGRLQYRAQRREHEFMPGVTYAQPCVQINSADADTPSIRTIEWKHAMATKEAAKIRGTVITTETPYTPEDVDCYEYPFPDRANRVLYARYRKMADAVPNLLIAGRLGEFRYLDMDQAIGRAMTFAERVAA